MVDGVVHLTEPVARHDGRRVADSAWSVSPIKRQDRMRKRRGDDLDRACVPQLGVDVHDVRHDFVVRVEDDLLVLLGEVAPLVDQGREGFLSQEPRVGPSEVPENLEVPPVAIGECRAGIAHVTQLLVPREPIDDLWVDVPEPRHDERLLVVRQLVGGDLGVDPVGVLGPIDDVLELQEQHGGEVEGDVEALVVGHHRSHVVVVLGGMHANPRTCHHPVGILRIQRLVLVPHEVDEQILGIERLEGWPPDCTEVVVTAVSVVAVVVVSSALSGVQADTTTANTMTRRAGRRMPTG